MEDQERQDKKKQPDLRDLWRLILAIVAVVAIFQELRKSSDERTWHGKVAGIFPYDFRKPTVERFRTTYWNPDGPILSGKAWGVGWAPNFGVIKRYVGG